ncbi:YchJ family protein [Peterkaempfera bronchialis]|uniref:YchJ family protein n=1 Tax=Peterkaempfera bronchialis TaxID=2126346 RepID=UPI003C2B8249
MSRHTRRPHQSASRTAPRNAPDGAPRDCPCGLPAAYDACCGRLHRGEATAATPEQLMRSRFSAFAVHDDAYLLRSWHPTTRPPAIGADPALRWVRLDILGSTGGGPFHTEGTVEFRAHWAEHGRTGELHEQSRFVRHDGTWVYLDGVVSD